METNLNILPKIFVFCNSCQPNWHGATALTQDGFFIASHLCSNHGFIMHDMGVHPTGWKRDIYDVHYPDGYDVVFEENPLDGSAEFKAAYEKHKSYTKEQYEEKMLIHKKHAGEETK